MLAVPTHSTQALDRAAMLNRIGNDAVRRHAEAL